MRETIQSFLRKVKKAAEVLEEPTLLGLITSISDQTAASKLRILIVGSAGSGRFSVGNVILGKPELLPSSPIPKTPASLHVTYGDHEAVEVLLKDGTRNATLSEKLRVILSSANKEADKITKVEIKTDCNLLKTCEVRIETIGAWRSEMEWQEIFAGTDYTILVLKATALLSEQERAFIGGLLSSSFGLERVAIVVNQIDLVAEEERSSISELVYSFLGPFESQPMLIEFSAAQVNKGLPSNDIATETGYEAFMALVKNDIVESNSSLKSRAVRQAAEICLAEIINRANRQKAVIATDETEIKQLLERFDSQNQWTHSRVERAQRRVDLFINTVVKEQFLREAENFSNTLRQQLPEEVKSVEDIDDVRRHLTAYVQALWEQFFNNQLAPLRNKLVDEMKRITEGVKDDLREQLGERVQNCEAFLSGFDPTPSDMRAFIMPRRSNAQADQSAWGLGLTGGIIMLVFANIPLGLATIGAGQVVRLLNKKSIEASEKEALIASAVTATQELERQIKAQLTNHFEQLTNSLKQAVADLYAEGIARIRDALEESLTRRKELEAKKEQLDQLIEIIIPELRQQLVQIVKR